MNENIIVEGKPTSLQGHIVGYDKNGKIIIELNNGDKIVVNRDNLAYPINDKPFRDYDFIRIGNIQIMKDVLYKPHCPDIVEIFSSTQIDYRVPQVAYSPETDTYYYNYLAAELEAQYLLLYIPTIDDMNYILHSINPNYKFVKDGMPTKEQKDNQIIAVDEIVEVLNLNVLGDIGCNSKAFTKKIDPFSPNGIQFELNKFHLMLSEKYSNEDAINTGRNGCGEYYTLYIHPSDTYPDVRYEYVYNDSLYPVKLIK